MSGARRLLRLKVPATLVAHSRLYSSSVISVVITCRRPPKLSLCFSVQPHISLSTLAVSVAYASETHWEIDAQALTLTGCQQFSKLSRRVCGARRTAALLIRPPSLPAKSRSSTAAAASTLFGLDMSIASAATRSGWPVSLPSLAAASSAAHSHYTSVKVLTARMT